MPSLEKRAELGTAYTKYIYLNPWLLPGLAMSEIYRYNGFNQLVSTSKGTNTVEYSYYASGLRATKKAGIDETRYILDGGNVVAERVGNTTTAKYIRGVNLLYSEISGTTSWYSYNAHGDVVQLMNEHGVALKSYDYDAFGAVQFQVNYLSCSCRPMG